MFIIMMRQHPITAFRVRTPPGAHRRTEPVLTESGDVLKIPLSAACVGFLAGLIVFLIMQSTAAAQPKVLQSPAVEIVYDPAIEHGAVEALDIFPQLKRELEALLALDLDIRPRIVLIKDTLTFQQLSRNDLFVAFAVPAENLIVIDYSRMKQRPFSLRITGKHELCHLLLHRHVDGSRLPRWFDEGICQWVSDGIGEIYTGGRWSGLDAAVMAGSVLDFNRIAGRFPVDRAALMLAYAQSKSIVTYIDRKYGTEGILDILKRLEKGDSMETAVSESLGASFDELQSAWLRQLESTPRWLVFLSDNLYAILFFAAAVLTIFGFIRRRVHRRRWERGEAHETIDD